ncbi:MAG: hypothetical protein M3347_14420, partial [Armatimonadota bacterium]|nr:hypothetical protein [Armatimonadota bacterium]
MDESRSLQRAVLRRNVLWFLPIAVLIAAYAVKPLYGYTDFYAHAAVGRRIYETGAIPRHTLFLWSAQVPWIAHSWLSEIFMYGLMRFRGDFVGEYLAVLWTLATMELTFGLIYFGANRGTLRLLPVPLLALVAFGLGVYGCRYRFAPRPELFSNLATVVLLLALVRWRQMPHWSA